MKIGSGVLELWWGGVENPPIPLTWPMAYIQQLVLPYKPWYFLSLTCLAVATYLYRQLGARHMNAVFRNDLKVQSHKHVGNNIYI